jgi:hypothetical protein
VSEMVTKAGNSSPPAKPVVRLELTGTVADDISTIVSALSHFARVFFSSLAEVTEAAKDRIIKRLRRSHETPVASARQRHVEARMRDPAYRDHA